MRRLALIVGILLILASGYSLLGGSFSLTDRETVLDLGPVQATATTEKNYAIPPIVAGLGLVVGLGAVVYGVSKGS